MIENKTHFKNSVGSEKSFGIIFSLLFLGLFFIFSANFQLISYFFFVGSVIFLFLSFFYRKLLKIPNLYWTKFGVLLGGLISPIILGAVYFVAIFPVGILLKTFGKDLLNLKFKRTAKTYWVNRDRKSINFKNQF